jgi:hypothetical protein
MAADANLVLQASVTKTDTFNGTGVDLATGTPRGRTLVARVIYSAASAASGTDTVIFSVDHSSDNSTFNALASGAKDTITLDTTSSAPKSGEIFIPFETSLRYVRLTVTFSANTHTDTITYYGDILLSRP